MTAPTPPWSTPNEEPRVPTPTPKLLLTVEEAADRLGIGRTLMYALIKDKHVKTVTIGRLRRIRPCDLETYTATLATDYADAA